MPHHKHEETEVSKVECFAKCQHSLSETTKEQKSPESLELFPPKLWVWKNRAGLSFQETDQHSQEESNRSFLGVLSAAACRKLFSSAPCLCLIGFLNFYRGQMLASVNMKPTLSPTQNLVCSRWKVLGRGKDSRKGLGLWQKGLPCDMELSQEPRRSEGRPWLTEDWGWNLLSVIDQRED